MTIEFLHNLVRQRKREAQLDAEYRPYRAQLHQVGLSERKLRKMEPDARVRALEKAKLNPYDFIFLAC